jgi:hypothetical protein
VEETDVVAALVGTGTYLWKRLTSSQHGALATHALLHLRGQLALLVRLPQQLLTSEEDSSEI